MIDLTNPHPAIHVQSVREGDRLLEPQWQIEHLAEAVPGILLRIHSGSTGVWYARTIGGLFYVSSTQDAVAVPLTPSRLLSLFDGADYYVEQLPASRSA